MTGRGKIGYSIRVEKGLQVGDGNPGTTQVHTTGGELRQRLHPAGIAFEQGGG
jgi:hypothetical protein